MKPDILGSGFMNRLMEHGIPCLVTPPSMVPHEYGNRFKTDRRDSSKLLHLLAKGMLKRVWVPSEEELYHRQVIRRRRQLVRIGCAPRAASRQN
jgi:transposase